MPIYVTFLAFFSLSSLAFPGTNSFIGEFLILAGGFTKSKLVTGFAIPGAILAAAYMLRMLQKVVWGAKANPNPGILSDLNLREVVTLMPLLLFVFWIGLKPEPFLTVMHTSVAHLLDQVNQANPQATMITLNLLP